MEDSSNKKGEQLFSSALTFLSILLGVFTFSLVSAVKLRGTYPEAYAWYCLTLISGISIVLSGIICTLSFICYNRTMNKGLERLVNTLFFIILGICGLGVPLIGFWLFFTQ